MKKIFIGGFGGSGTRVVSMILEKGGYFVGDTVNEANDYLGVNTKGTDSFTVVFNSFYFRKTPRLQKFLAFKDRESFAIKHGHLMFIIEDLKKWHPESVFIYVYRNPIDNMMNQYLTHNIYGNLKVDADLQDKVNYYIDVSKKVIGQSDLSVKLEDLCFKTNETIKKILNLAEIQYDNIEDYSKIIKVPDSIGRGKEYYDSIDCSALGY